VCLIFIWISLLLHLLHRLFLFIYYYNFFFSWFFSSSSSSSSSSLTSVLTFLLCNDEMVIFVEVSIWNWSFRSDVSSWILFSLEQYFWFLILLVDSKFGVVVFVNVLNITIFSTKKKHSWLCFYSSLFFYSSVFSLDFCLFCFIIIIFSKFVNVTWFDLIVSMWSVEGRIDDSASHCLHTFQ